MHRSRTIYKQKLSKNILVDFYVRGQQGVGFWRKCYYGFIFLALMMDLCLTNIQLFHSQDVN